MSEIYNSTMVLNKSPDSPVVTPAVFTHPLPTTYALGIYSAEPVVTVHELSFWGLPDTGTEYPSNSLTLWWNKNKEHSRPLYNLTANFSAVARASVFLASNCIYILRNSVETACGKDAYSFGYVEGNTAYPFKIKIVPSAEYIAEKPKSTTVKISFQSWGNPVLYGAMENYPSFIGGDRSLLHKGAVYYSVLLTIMLSSVYNPQSASTGINWSVS